MGVVSSAVPASLRVMMAGDVLMKLADVTVIATVRTVPTKRAVLSLNIPPTIIPPTISNAVPTSLHVMATGDASMKLVVVTVVSTVQIVLTKKAVFPENLKIPLRVVPTSLRVMATGGASMKLAVVTVVETVQIMPMKKTALPGKMKIPVRVASSAVPLSLHAMATGDVSINLAVAMVVVTVQTVQMKRAAQPGNLMLGLQMSKVPVQPTNLPAMATVGVLIQVHGATAVEIVLTTRMSRAALRKGTRFPRCTSVSLVSSSAGLGSVYAAANAAIVLGIVPGEKTSRTA